MRNLYEAPKMRTVKFARVSVVTASGTSGKTARQKLEENGAFAGVEQLKTISIRDLQSTKD